MTRITDPAVRMNVDGLTRILLIVIASALVDYSALTTTLRSRSRTTPPPLRDSALALSESERVTVSPEPVTGVRELTRAISGDKRALDCPDSALDVR